MVRLSYLVCYEFYYMVIFFYTDTGISVMGTGGLVYYQTEAIIGSVITGISMIFWYKDSMSIYHSLKWTEEDEIEKEREWKKEMERQTETQGKYNSEGNKYIFGYILYVLMFVYACML